MIERKKKFFGLALLMFFHGGTQEQADNLDEEEVPIVMEIAERIQRSRKDRLPARHKPTI